MAANHLTQTHCSSANLENTPGWLQAWEAARVSIWVPVCRLGEADMGPNESVWVREV